MRQIKFRAWDKKYKIMTACVTLKHISEGFEGINNNIVMQFTGLKDKNGKEIYEGDLIKFWDYLGEVYYEDGQYVFSEVEPYKYYELYYIDLRSMIYEEQQEIEVIGNIYENPELLKEKE